MRRFSLALLLITMLILIYPTQADNHRIDQSQEIPVIPITDTDTPFRRHNGNIQLSDHGFAISINQGQPSVIFPDDAQRQWIHVFIGRESLENIYIDWHNKSDGVCNGTTCEILLDAHPTSGNYVAYVQFYGTDDYLGGDEKYWAGPLNFSLIMDAPFAPTDPNVYLTNDIPTFTWTSPARATWFQLWVGDASIGQTAYSEWHRAADLGCFISLTTCTLTPGISVTYGQNYDWYVRAWGPGGVSVGGDVKGWAIGPRIITGPTVPDVPPGEVFDGFGLGGQVDGFAHPAWMHVAEMTWVKAQVRYSQGDTADNAQFWIDKARHEQFDLVLGVVGDPNQLAANPDQYMMDFAQFLGDLASRMDYPSAIEVWNEPNIDREWPQGMISGAMYTNMLRAAYTSIKLANPNVLVISAAPAPTGVSIGGVVVPDDQYLNEMVSAGAANVLDCVGLHYNEGIVSPTQTTGDPRGDHYSRYFPAMVSLYSSAFPGKPLCFTEIGYLSAEGVGTLPPAFSWASNTTVANQAQWLGEAARMSRDDPNIRLMIVWNVDFTRFDTDPMGGFAIVRPGGDCPACFALRDVMLNP